MRARPQPPARGVVRFYDFPPPRQTFLEDVLAGLSLPQKSVPPKYFYDEQGCRLFEAICELPEYYVTRTEIGILERSVGEIAQFTGPETQLIEFGSGAQAKIRLLIDALRPLLYVPIDIAGETLRDSSADLARRFPWLNIAGICADYTRTLDIPAFGHARFRRRVVFFPGSTIGNLAPAEAVAFLTHARRTLGSGGALIIGVDLKKDKRVLDAAYSDSQGVTAKFNLNLLHRINRELGGDFQVSRFRHKAFYDSSLGRVEMHLESLDEQVACVGGRRFEFVPGETIHTENSCKYSISEFQELGRRAGFSPEKVWSDPQEWFAVHGMIAI